MRALIIVLYGVLSGIVILNNATADELLAAEADGWHTWQVDEPGVSSEMCCFTWKGRKGSASGCNLDGGSMSFTNSGDCAAAPGTIQVYVQMIDGTPEDIRVLSSNCPVSTKSTVTDHGVVSTAENIDWFRTVIENKRFDNDVREEALFGLVQTESDAAFDYLDGLLTSR